MGYDEQLSAAKFRAERDIARQECERLRARLRDSVPREAYERKRAAWLRQIRECEAALRKRREHIKRLENAALERRTVREEDREAAERDLARQELYRARRDAENMRVDLCSALVIDVDTGWSDAMAELDRRLMPEGYEWPRFEDGDPVRIGDVVSDVEVRSVVFRDGGILLSDCTSVPGWGTWRSYKEPIKRPTPKVLDADGVEIRVGDRVWSTHLDEPHEWIVIDPHEDRDDSQTVLVSIGDRTGHARPEDLTHRAPVLAADGKPLREGEMVYHIESGDEFTVMGVDAESGDAHVRWGYDFEDKSGSIAAKLLTHERPVADTWERLEEDAEKDPCSYFGFDGEETCGKCPASGKGCEQTMARDLVRRAKALAERGQS